MNFPSARKNLFTICFPCCEEVVKKTIFCFFSRANHEEGGSRFKTKKPVFLTVHTVPPPLLLYRCMHGLPYVGQKTGFWCRDTFSAPANNFSVGRAYWKFRLRGFFENAKVQKPPHKTRRKRQIEDGIFRVFGTFQMVYFYKNTLYQPSKRCQTTFRSFNNSSVFRA